MVRAADRGARAARMYAEMHTFQQIADALGYASRSGVQKAIWQHARRTRENMPEPEVARFVEVEHLDYLRSELALQVQEGDQGAIAQALKISERKAKLLGLDLNESRVAGALEAGAVASLMAASNLQAIIIAAMGEVGMPLEQQDRLVEAINARLTDQPEDEEDLEPEMPAELVIIEGEVERDERIEF